VTDLRFDLSGIGIGLHGVPDAAAAWIERAWDGFRAGPGGDDWLDVEVAIGATAIDRSRPFAPKAMRARFARPTARFEMDDGCAEVGLDGPARITLARDLRERAPFALLNLVRACLAWRLPSRGGVLLHAAGLVVEGRAFVLVGSEGSGKTTWVELGRSAGAIAVSDDLVLLDAVRGDVELVGAPFRSRLSTPSPRGRWPLAGILFPARGPDAVLADVPRAIAGARLVANLPFVAEAWSDDERLPRVVDGLLSRIPYRDLTFDRTPGFLRLLRV
jgi:hypothetical protein